MLTHRVGLRLASIVLLGLALTAGCSTNHSGNSAQRLVGSLGIEADNGLGLSANPLFVVIDPSDTTGPIDPAHNNEHYGTTVLLAVAMDTLGVPQAGLNVMFSAAGGVLRSGGDTLQTDASGQAMDSLRVYPSDPDSFQVSVTDGERVTSLFVHRVLISPPVAHAGADQTVECTGDSSAQVTLNGSASTDPNGDITTYEWFEHYGTPEQVLLDTGAIVDVVLSDGQHVITLRVTDATGASSTDEVIVTVADTQPPTVEIAVSPSKLWPPNHKLVPVHVRLHVTECSAFTVTLVSVTSNEPDNGLGDGDTTGDIQGAETGTADYDFLLRAERAGGGSGRVYRIVYSVVDAGGVETLVRARVTVPHDQGGK
jgi:hypothetical protein